MKDKKDLAAEIYDIIYSELTNPKITEKEVEIIKSEIKPKGRILDLGCGTGKHLIPLLKSGYEVIGLDISKDMLRVLKKKAAKDRLKPKLIHGEINKIKGESFDGIICFGNAFCEIAKNESKAKETLKIIFNSLNNKGKLIIEETDPETFNFSDFEYNSKADINGKTYETVFKAIEFKEENNAFVAEETIKIKENNKIIDEIKQRFEQKWWFKKDLEKLCREAGFSKVKFYDKAFSQEYLDISSMVLVAEK
ncbi:MAG: class I SAM-dependent methyltransferase [Candidatus Woesearchaeota archaeon]|nr:MAG: class I SAM-dependent methyltransferase [Candidatus Woesearchaeota archaeon]